MQAGSIPASSVHFMYRAYISHRPCAKCGAIGEQIWVQTLPEPPHPEYGWCTDCRLGRRVLGLAELVLEALRKEYLNV
jgi:hypothetical protein